MKIDILSDPKDSRSAKLTVGLRFFNNTQSEAYLFAPYLFPNGEVINSHFQFTPREQVRYIGPAVKPHFTEEDIIVLGPMETVYTEFVDLRRAYKFPSQDSSKFDKFEYRYSAPHPLDAEGKHVGNLESDWVLVNPSAMSWGFFDRHLKRHLNDI